MHIRIQNNRAGKYPEAPEEDENGDDGVELFEIKHLGIRLRNHADVITRDRTFTVGGIRCETANRGFDDSCPFQHEQENVRAQRD